MKKKRKVGRPTKYKDKYAKMLVEFFDVEPYTDKEISKVTTENVKILLKIDRKPNKLPTFHKFAKLIKVNGDTIVEWANPTIGKGKNKKYKYPKFADAYNQAKELQKYFLIENGLNGLYPSPFAIFTAKNITDMRDQQEVDHTSKGKKIQWNIISYKDIPNE